MDLFQDLIERELTELHQKENRTVYNNLTHAENTALNDLSTREDIIIQMADKGGAITVLDRKLYYILNINMLNDKDTFRSLHSDPTVPFPHSLKQLLDGGVTTGAISPSEAEKLTVMHPVTPILHSLPKLHKGTFPPPLRPIVAGMGSMGERLSAWVDSHLQPLIEITPSYIKDTKELVHT